MINEVAKKTNKQTNVMGICSTIVVETLFFCKWPIELDPKALCLCLMLAVKTPYCRWISLTNPDRTYIYILLHRVWGKMGDKREHTVWNVSYNNIRCLCRMDHNWCVFAGYIPPIDGMTMEKKQMESFF